MAGWLPLVTAGGGAGSPPSIDPNGSAIGFFQLGSGTSTTVTISTTNSNDVIIMDLSDSSGASSAVVSSPSLTWTKRTSVFPGSATTERWFAIAASPLTSEVITISGLSNSFSRGTAVAISGANTAAPFDAGGPVSGSTADPQSITTASPNTLILAYFTCNTPTSPGAGWTTVHTAAGDFAISEYQTQTAAGTYSATLGTGGTGTASTFIIDGIKA